MKEKKIPTIKKFLSERTWALALNLRYREEIQYRTGHIQFFINNLAGRGINYFYVKKLDQERVPHFYILIDRYIDKSEVRDIWNNAVGEELEHGTSMEEVKNQTEMIDYLLRDLREYGSSLNLENTNHREAFVLSRKKRL